MALVESIARIVGIALNAALIVKAILEIIRIVKDNNRPSDKK